MARGTEDIQADGGTRMSECFTLPFFIWKFTGGVACWVRQNSLLCRHEVDFTMDDHQHIKTTGAFWRKAPHGFPPSSAFYSLVHVARSIKSCSQSTSAKTASSLNKSIS